MKLKTISKYLITSIFLFSIFLGFGFYNQTEAAASLSLSASATTIYTGNQFIIYPSVNAGGAATNTYSVNISFPSSLLQVVNISTGGSICTLYPVQPSYTSSTASISCGLPSPGYNGSGGGLGSITFRSLAKGTATVSISGSSQVLANDGLGTNILGSTGSIAIKIIDAPPSVPVPVPTPTPTPIQALEAPTVTASVGSNNECISTKEITFNWNTPQGVTGFSYLFTQDQNAALGQINLGSETSKTYTDLVEGTYFFKIAGTNGSRWSGETTYILLIDNTPPENLEIVSDPSNDKNIDRLPLISFNATDSNCGIDHYELKIDDGEFFTTDNPYQMESLTSGEHQIIVKAIDKAGNATEGVITFNAISIITIITKPKDGTYLPMGENLYVEGSTVANATVYIYLNDELIAEVTANDQGMFSYTYDTFLFPKEYELTAQAKNPGGILGPKSEIVTFKVDAYAIRIGSLIVHTFWLLLLILILLLFLILLIIFLCKRYKDYEEETEQKVKKTQGKVNKRLESLEDEIKEEVKKTLNQNSDPKKTQQLTHKLEREIDEDIQKAEKEIEKDIKKTFSKGKK